MTAPATMSTALPSVEPPAASLATTKGRRILGIDALRGLVMALMLVDHVREYFYLHAQVSDPVVLATTPPGLFFTRLAAHLCAPVFVILTGVAAWLYGQRHGGRRAASGFLFKRGLFLLVLELTVVNFAWTFQLLPPTYYFQVIGAIGLSMMVLATLLHLPRPALLGFALLVLLGHNLLDPVHFAAGEPGHTWWALLHDRGFIDLPWGARLKTSYPVLPWMGVIALGYAVGPWFSSQVQATTRRRWLLLASAGALALFGVLRLVNVYGEPLPWSVGATPLETVMSFLNLTKYPPSLDFLLLTLGVGAALLALLDLAPEALSTTLAVFGAAPLFFYVVHLYLLHALNRLALAALGPNQGTLFSLPGVGSLWLLAAVITVPMWFACRAFARLKARSRSPWMSYL
nr:heparan-alpha-glucosaminide N-acetyltransferase domain-containing protein [Myxococcus sp. MH1]